MRGKRQEKPDEVHATTEAGTGKLRLSDGPLAVQDRDACEARYDERKSLTRPEDDRKAVEARVRILSCSNC